MQRFVQILELVDSPEIISEYRRIHDEIWPEITQGIRSVGIDRMDIYLHCNRAVMIVEMPDNIDFDTAMSRLAVLPRQQEWEEYVARFQECAPMSTSSEKWKMMERMFYLYD